MIATNDPSEWGTFKNTLHDDFWVFGYGSLMWNPGFVHSAVHPATLYGYHRAFCIYSHFYRGTPERPGLVLGLSPGGQCQGLAFRIDRQQAETVKAYLHEREMVSYAYVAKTLPVSVGEASVQSYTFVADKDHSQYAGNLGIDKTAEMIMEAKGEAGLNRDYLINTIRRLEAQGFVDQSLHDLLRRIESLTGILDAGAGI